MNFSESGLLKCDLIHRFFGKKSMERADSGLWGEQQAAGYLKKNGFRILAQRIRLGRDEIDLIVRDDDCIVFVEVKTRRSAVFGTPAKAVDRRKKHALSRAAIHYLKKKHFPPVSIRFDIVEVLGTPGLLKDIKHIENAFTLDRRFRLPY